MLVEFRGRGTTPSTVRIPPTYLGTSDFRAYCRLSGDRVVVVPNGLYTAGDLIDAYHPPTTGPLKGSLVLVAETPGGVIVDQSPPGTPLAGGLNANGDLDLNGATCRLVLIGMAFRNGSIHLAVPQVFFWYTDHSFPLATWEGEPGWPNGYHPDANRAFYLLPGAYQGGIYGADFHDAGSLVFGGGFSFFDVVGVHGYNQHGNSPLQHPDAFGLVTGNFHDVKITDSHIEPGVGENNNTGIIAEDFNGKIYNFDMARLWVHNAGIGINLTSGVDGAPSRNGVFGTMTDIWSWDNVHHIPTSDTSSWDINASVDGVSNLNNSSWYPSRMNFVETNVHRSVVPTGTDPATTWRAEHPIDSWADYFTAKGLWR